MKTPSYPPVRGRLYTFYGLRFPNCVSAIFHFSLFTFHSSLFTKEGNVTSLPPYRGIRGGLIFPSSLFTLHFSLKETYSPIPYYLFPIT